MADLAIALQLTVNEQGVVQKVNDVSTALQKTGVAAQEAQTKSSGLGSVLGNVAQVAGGFLVAHGLMELPHILGDTVTAARESALANAQLDQVIASTGGKAGITADAVRDLATQWMGIAKIDDDVILGGQNLLLTFTNIGEDVFPQATEAMLNMSAALGQDAKQSAIQLGKALNDPVQGATALRRVGVSLTDQQMEQITAFQESGDLMSAQKVILDELSVEFGGAAAAIGASKGPLEDMNVAWGEMQERIGGKLIPVLADLAGKGLAAFQWLDASGTIDAALDGLGAAAETAGNVIGGAFELIASAAQTDLVQGLTAALGVAAATVSAFAAGDMTVAIQTLEDNFDLDLSPLSGAITTAQGMLQTLSDAWITVGQVFANDWSPSDEIDPFVNAVGTAATVIRDQLIPPVQQAADVVKTGLGAALGELPGVLDAVGGAVSRVVGFVRDNVAVQSVLVGILTAAATQYALTTAATIAHTIATQGVALATSVWTAAQAALNVALTANPIGIVIVGLAALAAGIIYAYNNSEDFRNAVDALGAALGTFWDQLVTGVQGALAATGQFLADVQTTWDAIPGIIQGALDTAGAFIQAGFTAAGDAITAALGLIQGAIDTVWTQIPEDIRADLVLIATYLVEQLAEHLATIQTWVTDTGAAFVDWGAQTWTQVQTTATNITTTLVTTFSDLVGKVGQWVSDFLTPITGGVGQAVEASATFGQGIVQGITDKIGEAVTAVQTWGGNVIETITGFVGRVVAAAQQVGQGMIDGITGALTAARDRVGSVLWDVVRAGLDQVKRSLGIASPSTWTAEQIGSPMAEGIIQGLVASFGNGDDRIGNAIRAVVETAIKAGIDPMIAAALAKAESSFNPSAVGDQGHSVGVFQLHDAGQGAGMGASRLDPWVNAVTFLDQHKGLFAELSQSLDGADLAKIFGGRAEVSDPQYWDRYAAAFNEVVAAVGALPAPTDTAAASTTAMSDAATTAAGTEQALTTAGNIKTAMATAQGGVLQTTAQAAGVLADANTVAAAAEDTHTEAISAGSQAAIDAINRNNDQAVALQDLEAQMLAGNVPANAALDGSISGGSAAAIDAIQRNNDQSVALLDLEDAMMNGTVPAFATQTTTVQAAGDIFDNHMTPAVEGLTAAQLADLKPALDTTTGSVVDQTASVVDTIATGVAWVGQLGDTQTQLEQGTTPAVEDHTQKVGDSEAAARKAIDANNTWAEALHKAQDQIQNGMTPAVETLTGSLATNIETTMKSIEKNNADMEALHKEQDAFGNMYDATGKLTGALETLNKTDASINLNSNDLQKATDRAKKLASALAKLPGGGKGVGGEAIKLAGDSGGGGGENFLAPEFGLGGFVPGSPGERIRAILHAGEFVLTPDQVAAMGSSWGELSPSSMTTAAGYQSPAPIQVTATFINHGTLVAQDADDWLVNSLKRVQREGRLEGIQVG